MRIPVKNGALKKKILDTCMISKEMRDYLSGEDLIPLELFDIIRGSLVSLRKKAELFDLLCAEYPGYREYVDKVHRALEELELNEGEIFCLSDRWYDEDYQREMRGDGILFLSLEDVKRHIRKEIDIAIAAVADDDEEVEDGDISYRGLGWYRLDKWEKTGEGTALGNPVSYIMIDTEPVYFIENEWDEEDNCWTLSDMRFSGHCDLNLPVPYKKGDLLHIDCRPFAPTKDVLILSTGDNRDCCSLWALSPGERGGWKEGAVKHASVFDGDMPFPLISPLYRLQRSTRGLVDWD